MNWRVSNRFSVFGRELADRHYSRRKVGSPQFVAPGSNLVLITLGHDALWITVNQRYILHEWPNAWMCSCFRNEGPILSSELIKQAEAVTRYRWGEVPTGGMITFINAAKVRYKRDPGRCFLRAGWKKIGMTKGGLIVLGIKADDMSQPQPPVALQKDLFPVSA